MLDKDQFICENTKPQILGPGAAWVLVTLPLLATPNYFDLKVAYDLARGGSLFGNLRIATAFQNVAGNFLRLVCIVDNNALFTNVPATPALVIARGPDIPSAQLDVVGDVVQIGIPPFGSLAREVIGDGAQFVTLAVECLVPAADWNAGGLDVFFSDKPLPLRPSSYTSGY